MEFTSLWQEFARISEVEAIALGGSRATGNYDETSDYDLYIYCSSIPDEATRLTILKRFCSHIEIGNHFWELEDDCTLMSGQDIDILYRDINQIKDELVDVVERCIIQNAYTTCLWHNVLHSKILYDSEEPLVGMIYAKNGVHGIDLQGLISGETESSVENDYIYLFSYEFCKK